MQLLRRRVYQPLLGALLGVPDEQVLVAMRHREHLPQQEALLVQLIKRWQAAACGFLRHSRYLIRRAPLSLLSGQFIEVDHLEHFLAPSFNLIR